MALSSFKFLQSIAIFRWTKQFRWYSQYAPNYQEAMVEKEETEKLVKKMSKHEIESIRIKAAARNQTCSVFHDKKINYFINLVMRCGKKKVAREIVEEALTLVKHTQLRKYNSETDEKLRQEIVISPREIFTAAVANSTPKLNVTKIRKSGVWYKVPVGITEKKANFIAMRWLIQSAKEKDPTVRFSKELADELIAASQGQGKAVKKRLELHKLCEANRSYAHYKWT